MQQLLPSSLGGLAALGRRASPIPLIGTPGRAERVGAEEPAVCSQAQKGANGSPKKSAPLSENEVALSYQFSLVLALNFHNTICNVIRSTHY